MTAAHRAPRRSAGPERVPDGLRAAMADAAAEIDAVMGAALDALPPGPVVDAMRHATTGGKRMRGFLVIEGARLHGGPDGTVAAAAIEALHAYSLVHDDLPAMDDDDLRRGRPTVHVAWDEATAILAGDALQSLAFGLLADPAAHPEPAVRVVLIAALAEAAGAAGMVRGQALDIAAEDGPPPTLEEVRALQAGKTGALIEWSAAAGAILAGADPAPMRRYGAALGAAFQVADDLIDATGDADAAGKAVGKDAAAGKATVLAHLGEAGARDEAARLVAEAEAALAPHGEAAAILRALARYTASRDR